MKRHATTLILCLATALALAGCGGDDDSSSTTTSEAAAVDTSTKPEVEVPSEAPPEELVIEDIVEGDGATAETGDTLTVQYVGVDYETGEEFDASWDQPEPFPFQLGVDAIIDGWQEGLVGMKVGGRRELIIPPDLAYGAQGSPPVIGPNATLVFVIDLLAVE